MVSDCSVELLFYLYPGSLMLDQIMQDSVSVYSFCILLFWISFLRIVEWTMEEGVTYLTVYVFLSYLVFFWDKTSEVCAQQLSRQFRTFEMLNSVITQAASENRRTKTKLLICNMVSYGQTNRAWKHGLNINLLHTLLLIYFLQ